MISSAAGVRAIPLPRNARVAIGRMHTCDIVIEDESVSRQHAALHSTPGGLSIEDLGSRNKTQIMGRSLGRGETAPLAVGSVVEIRAACLAARRSGVGDHPRPHDAAALRAARRHRAQPAERARSGRDRTPTICARRETWERAQIMSALERTSGNQKEAAKLLGISRRTLINKIEAYGIARPRKR